MFRRSFSNCSLISMYVRNCVQLILSKNTCHAMFVSISLSLHNRLFSRAYFFPHMPQVLGQAMLAALPSRVDFFEHLLCASFPIHLQVFVLASLSANDKSSLQSSSCAIPIFPRIHDLKYFASLYTPGRFSDAQSGSPAMPPPQLQLSR